MTGLLFTNVFHAASLFLQKGQLAFTSRMIRARSSTGGDKIEVSGKTEAGTISSEVSGSGSGSGSDVIISLLSLGSIVHTPPTQRRPRYRCNTFRRMSISSGLLYRYKKIAVHARVKIEDYCTDTVSIAARAATGGRP